MQDAQAGTGSGKIIGDEHKDVLQSSRPSMAGEQKVIYNNEFVSAFFLIALISGLLAMSYWAGVSDLEDFADEDDQNAEY